MAGFATPEEAALGGWDARYVRVVQRVAGDPTTAELLGVGPDGLCVIELATNEEPTTYPYFIQCIRRDDGWHEVAGQS